MQLLAKRTNGMQDNYIEPKATIYYACSKSAAEWLFPKKQKAFYIKEWDRYVKNSIFLKQQESKVRKELRIKKKTIVMGHVGRFSYPKNHSFLIEIFAIIKINTNSILLLVGDGELRMKLKRKLKNLI